MEDNRQRTARYRSVTSLTPTSKACTSGASAKPGSGIPSTNGHRTPHGAPVRERRRSRQERTSEQRKRLSLNVAFNVDGILMADSLLFFMGRQNRTNAQVLI